MGWAVLEGNEDDLLLDKTVHNAQSRSIGIIIGADCTIPSDIDTQRIAWVREALAE